MKRPERLPGSDGPVHRVRHVQSLIGRHLDERIEARVDLLNAEFCRRYGLPGASSLERWGRPDRMSLSLFREEAKRAWTILRMYEAALKRDREGATRLVLEHCAEAAERTDNLEDASVMGVLAWSVTLVAQTVSSLCRPGVSFEGLVKGEPDASGIRSAWFFNNL